MKVYWLLVLGIVGCTKRNPAVCCLDQADCDEAGLSGIRECATGLACVEHECVVPSCAMAGCEATAPVCNINIDVCEGCSDSSQCANFGAANVCKTETGACVECITAADCDASKPVCDADVCRGCKLDAECPSGACGDDGACVAEDAIVYLAPNGTDTGTCTRAAACRSITFGVSRTTALRNHVVMAQGGYSDIVHLTPQSTPAAHLYIHGGGAWLSQPIGTVEGVTLRASLPTTLRHLDVRGESGGGSLELEAGTHVLEHVIVRGGGGRGLFVNTSSATIRDLLVEDASSGIGSGDGAHLEIDGLRIVRGATGLYLTSSTVQITNALIYGQSQRGINATSSNGTLSFITVANSGSDAGTGPRAVFCDSGITVRSSIIWAPGTAARLPIDGCNLESTITGPLSVPGGMNITPGFVNLATGDYHLAPGSPARDAVDIGPASDFEGDPRPLGPRFDIGADEAMP